MWGTTVTSGADKEHVEHMRAIKGRNRFLSIEPLLRAMDMVEIGEIPVEWVIMGAMPGPRAARHRPQAGWIVDIVRSLEMQGTPAFIKNNILSSGQDRILEEPARQDSASQNGFTRGAEYYERGASNADPDNRQTHDSSPCPLRTE